MTVQGADFEADEYGYRECGQRCLVRRLRIATSITRWIWSVHRPCEVQCQLPMEGFWNLDIYWREIAGSCNRPVDLEAHDHCHRGGGNSRKSLFWSFHHTLIHIHADSDLFIAYPGEWKYATVLAQSPDSGQRERGRRIGHQGTAEAGRLAGCTQGTPVEYRPASPLCVLEQATWSIPHLDEQETISIIAPWPTLAFIALAPSSPSQTFSTKEQETRSSGEVAEHRGREEENEEILASSHEA